MKKQHTSALFAILCLCFLTSCGSDEESNITVDLIRNIKILDLENTGNAGDFLVGFDLADNEIGFSEIRLALAPKSTASNLTSKAAENLPSEAYTKVAVSGAGYEVRLEAAQTDTEGGAIQPNTEYVLHFILMENENAHVDVQKKTVELTSVHYLTGEYTGTWNDNIYTDFGISANLTGGGSSVSGPFFYSINFTSCCGGDNDGQINIKFDETGAVTNFRYTQNLAQFMGGACPGLYEGGGLIENLTTFKIDFEGEDCEGPHTNGKILLRKKF